MTFWYIAVALLLIYIVIPRFGLLALYKDWQAARQRERVEDALKHLLDREQGGKEHLRAQNIEPHVLFNISQAFEWLREVELLSAGDYKTIMAYIEAEKHPGNGGENKNEAGQGGG